ncbi:hypothetical protein C8R47DRAFT_146041 [Mycena vitilis]|nr:hypothetical protein C8R47DRAFT_146041 [Mycena vitilis]
MSRSLPFSLLCTWSFHLLLTVSPILLHTIFLTSTISMPLSYPQPTLHLPVMTYAHSASPVTVRHLRHSLLLLCFIFIPLLFWTLAIRIQFFCGDFDMSDQQPSPACIMSCTLVVALTPSIWTLQTVFSSFSGSSSFLAPQRAGLALVESAFPWLRNLWSHVMLSSRLSLETPMAASSLNFCALLRLVNMLSDSTPPPQTSLLPLPLYLIPVLRSCRPLVHLLFFCSLKVPVVAFEGCSFRA